MIEMTIKITDYSKNYVEINSDIVSDENEATETEMIVFNDIIDLLDNMISNMNKDDVENTTQDILSNIGKNNDKV